LIGKDPGRDRDPVDPLRGQGNTIDLIRLSRGKAKPLNELQIGHESTIDGRSSGRDAAYTGRKVEV